MTQERLFEAYTFGAEERSQLDRDGHFAFPGLLTAHARSRLTDSLEHISALPNTGDFTPQRYSAEYDSYLASLIAHPQLLDMARGVLGKSIRFDHCVALTRPSGDRGIGWHIPAGGAIPVDRLESGFGIERRYGSIDDRHQFFSSSVVVRTQLPEVSEVSR